LPTEPTTDEMMLFALTELEKLNLIVRRLIKKGVLTERDYAMAEVESKFRNAERRAGVEEAEGRAEQAKGLRAEAAALKRRLETLQED